MLWVGVSHAEALEVALDSRRTGCMSRICIAGGIARSLVCEGMSARNAFGHFSTAKGERLRCNRCFLSGVVFFLTSPTSDPLDAWTVRWVTGGRRDYAQMNSACMLFSAIPFLSERDVQGLQCPELLLRWDAGWCLRTSRPTIVGVQSSTTTACHIHMTRRPSAP